MEIRHLRYFVAVAEALSFTNAAIMLHLAQPSPTRQIKGLEEELGVLLLNRTKHERFFHKLFVERWERLTALFLSLVRFHSIFPIMVVLRKPPFSLSYKAPAAICFVRSWNRLEVPG